MGAVTLAWGVSWEQLETLLTHLEVSVGLFLKPLSKFMCTLLISRLSEPLFYLHHGNLDRIFWEWQSKDWTVRLNQVGGPVAALDYGGKNVTLDFEVSLGALAENATLHDLLNPVGETLCYTY